MTEAMTARAARRPARPAGRKTANRFASLAGGDVTITDSTTGASGDDNGLIGAMSAAAAADQALRIVQLPVNDIAPHPFNDPRRSQPQPGDPKWEELLNGVRAAGVRLPVLAVPREAFQAARPAAAKQIPADARYILVYGHRRRIAALEAGRTTVPAVVDDSIMADEGDLDAMTTENLGRQDLPELAQANLFARYSEIGLTQRSIASRLGIDQATVSRRLALLLLAPEVLQAVDDGSLPGADAAALAGALPYGPPRRWQKTKEAQQNTEQRRDEQIQALRLILDRGMTSTRAAERVIAERDARAQAARWGIPVVDDPRAELGERFYEHRIPGYERNANLIGAIEPGLGTLVLYARPGADPARGKNTADKPDPADRPEVVVDSSAPEPTSPHGPPSDQSPGKNIPRAGGINNGDAQRDPAGAAAARAHRRQACAALITQQVSNSELLRILVGQYLSGVAARAASSAVPRLLRDWDADMEGNSEKARASQAWHRAIAAAELHTSDLADKSWDDTAAAHLQLLIDRVGYQPTPWEQDQLDATRR